MATINRVLQRVLAWALLLCVVLGLVIGYLHFAAEYRQAQREVIYLKARQLAAEQQQQRVQAYKKRLAEQRLQQQYRQGRVEGVVPAR